MLWAAGINVAAPVSMALSDRKIATILWLDAELQSLGGLMIDILRYWGKQVHKFAGIWFAVISRLTANNSEEFRCYSAAASSER
jgi:hypothetical protein